MPTATTERRQIHLPAYHPGQQRIVSQARRYNVLDCGRRWGKTAMVTRLLCETALPGKPAAYFASQYKYLDPVWQDLKSRLAPMITSAPATKMLISLVGGGSIEMWSLEDVDAGRSRAYARVVIDEAAMVPHLGRTWGQAIRPTLADLGGDAWLPSTPKGRNFFWECYQRGLDPLETEWACWQAPTADNPYIRRSEIEALRQSMTDRNYRQEILAEFLEDAGGVFRGVRKLSVLAPGEPLQGHTYVAGIDWGRVDDYTVVSVWDMTTQEEVFLDRYNGLPYTLQRARIGALCDTWHLTNILAESNSIGEPIIEQLHEEGLPVQGFGTTNASKAVLVDRLALALERETCILQADLVGVGEMEAFEATALPSGVYRYAAPDGQHDDIVIARCLGWALVDTSIDWGALLDRIAPATPVDPDIAEERRRQEAFEREHAALQAASDKFERELERARKGRNTGNDWQRR